MTKAIGCLPGGESADAHGDAPIDMSAEMSALRMIVDDVDYGVVLLDAERRVRYVNRAFRSFWRIPDGLVESGPTFIKLMYHGRGVTPYAVAQDRLGDYIARQLALIRSGEEGPLSIQLSSGEVLQFRCKALSGGDRMLTYGKVSELFHAAEALERLACVDALTGLSNRRHFLAQAESEWARFRRYGRPLALLMFDIDHFKSVNDTYGHDAGDEVLKAVAAVLGTHRRSTDVAGRLGGEEFALILIEVTPEAALAVAERLRQFVAAHSVAVDTNRISVTISIGVCNAEAGMSGVDELIKKTDIALYEAKRSGRNRACRFTPQAQS